MELSPVRAAGIPDAAETDASLIHRMHFPVPSLLNYLPGIYYEEGTRKHSQFWTLLQLIRGNYDWISRIIDHIDKYVDVDNTPAYAPPDKWDFLSWLGSWVAMVPDRKWEPQKRRMVIQQAAELHKYRGTPWGLKYMIGLFYEEEVELKEWVWPQGMIIEMYNTIEIDTRLHELKNLNHSFIVIWRPKASLTGSELDQKKMGIRKLIDTLKPAHTCCYFYVIEKSKKSTKKSGKNRKTSKQNGQRILM